MFYKRNPTRRIFKINSWRRLRHDNFPSRPDNYNFRQQTLQKIDAWKRWEEQKNIFRIASKTREECILFVSLFKNFAFCPADAIVNAIASTNGPFCPRRSGIVMHIQNVRVTNWVWNSKPPTKSNKMSIRSTRSIQSVSHYRKILYTVLGKFPEMISMVMTANRIINHSQKGLSYSVP